MRYINCVNINTQRNLFKVPPQKRKKARPHYANSPSIGSQCSEDQETDSESEHSDSSVTLSQSDFSARSYDVESIRLFLKSTKNKRGVNVQDFFPDTKQFVEKTRSLMAEGSFTNKEVYCLKKIVRNLDVNVNNDV